MPQNGMDQGAVNTENQKMNEKTRHTDDSWELIDEKDAKLAKELFDDAKFSKGPKGDEILRPSRRKKKHWFRKTLIAVIALGAGVALAVNLYNMSTQPQYAQAILSDEEIDRMVRERLMHQTSRNLERIPVFAHRGFVEDTLDNTFAAFDLALLSGCPQIELDVRTSSDGVLYVCHDDTLNHIAGLDWKIAEHTSEELDQVVMKNGEKLHRLSEVIGRYRGQMIYLIEFKDDTKDAKPFADVVHEYPQYASTMQVQSFFPDILEAVHAELPNMFVQLLINQWWDVDKAIEYDWLDSLALDQKLVSADTVEKVHAGDKEIWVWTVDDPNEVRRFLDMGVDGVITDLDNAVAIYKEMSDEAFG